MRSAISFALDPTSTSRPGKLGPRPLPHHIPVAATSNHVLVSQNTLLLTGPRRPLSKGGNVHFYYVDS